MKKENETWIFALFLSLIIVVGFRFTGMAVAEDKYDSTIRIAAAEHDTSFALVKAIIKQESSFNPEAVSPTGCKGLMQFCEPAAKQYALCDKKGCSIMDDRFVADKSIDAGANFISDLVRKYNHYSAKYELALASYNGGSAVVDKAIEATGKDDPTWQEVASALKPEFITYFTSQEDKERKVEEIRNYVSKVMAYYKNYGGELIAESIGIYTVRPSFETEINYDFSDYEKIREGIRVLNKTCLGAGGAEDIGRCIKNNIWRVSTSDLKWSLGSCDTGKKAFFYSFVKAYQECFFSLDDDCICKGKPYGGGDLTEEIKLEFSGTGALIVSFDIFERELPGKLSYVQGGNILEPQALDWEFEIKKGEIKESNIKPDWGSFDKDSFNLYKKNSVLSLMAKEPGLDKKSECEIIQDHFQFCVTNNKKKFPKVSDGKLSIEPVVYKFALIFKDTTPPPKITDLQVKDLERAERNLTLKWSKSEAKDTHHYRVYFRDKKFTKMEDAENIFNTSSENETEVNISVAEDDKTYYFAVVAVDDSDNENPNVISKPGISKDDLPPAKPKDVTYEIKDSTIEFELTLPDYNGDGSEIRDDEELEAFILITDLVDKCPNINNPADLLFAKLFDVSEQSIGKGKKGEKIKKSLPYTLPNNKVCYAFTVKDEKGNVRILDENYEGFDKLIFLVYPT